MDTLGIRVAFHKLIMYAGLPQNVVGSTVRVYHKEGAADILVTSCTYSAKFDTLILGLAENVIVTTREPELSTLHQHTAPTLRCSRRGGWLLEMRDDDVVVGAIPVDVEFPAK